jgi:hypothetical protein
MKTSALLLTTALAALPASCGLPRPDTELHESASPPEGYTALDATSASLTGRVLRITVDPPGPVAEALVHWGGGFTKSIPPQTAVVPMVRLAASGEPALERAVLVVDLTPIVERMPLPHGLVVTVRGVEQRFEVR